MARINYGIHRQKNKSTDMTPLNILLECIFGFPSFYLKHMKRAQYETYFYVPFQLTIKMRPSTFLNSFGVWDLFYKLTCVEHVDFVYVTYQVLKVEFRN